MFVAMNRFQIRPGQEEAFETIWRERESHLQSMDGFQSFHLLRGPESEEHTLFISHTIWASKQHFEDWTRSEAFRQAHKNAGGARNNIYLGHPNFEGYSLVEGTEEYAKA
ncbi:MAG: antibiotic biosynthesis monooxygenase [Pseudomonadota bacterium]